MLGLELEGLSQEDQEYEAARQLVRLSGAATTAAAAAPPGASPQQVAQNAAVTAAQQYAPGMLRPNGAARPHRGRKNSGKWIRKGGVIIVLGA